jgi:Uncharacterized conserved protein
MAPPFKNCKAFIKLLAYYLLRRHMSSRLAQLAFVIRELGVRAGEVLSDGDDGLDTRIRIQKVVYFLKRLGLDLGYEFTLYYHGPYSPTLANDYYLLARLGDEEIGRLAELCVEGGVCSDEMDRLLNELNKWDTTALEVAATIANLLRSPDYRNDLNGAIDHVKFLKPWVTDNDIDRALRLLKSLGILKA